MPHDPLSDILSLFNAHCLFSSRLQAGGSWAVAFPVPNAIKFYAVVKGHCQILVAGQDKPIAMQAGDVVLFNGRNALTFASDLNAEPLDAVAAFSKASNGVLHIGTGHDFTSLGGHIAVDAPGMSFLADALPAALHIRHDLKEAGVLQWLLGQLTDEMLSDTPGAQLAVKQLAQLMFVQVLRTHIASGEVMTAGWLRALADPAIAPALTLMHSDPARDWRLTELAKAVGMSRTAFAVRFKATVGSAPLKYLLHWRMRLAQRALLAERTPVSALALSLGYTSESAFSNAFKRETGMAPSRYREANQLVA